MLESKILEERLHGAAEEELERRILEIAREVAGGTHGALFVWDEAEKALRLDFHIVDGVVMTVPGLLLRTREDGRPNGIALHVHETNRAYLCADSTKDPHYARYLVDVGCLAAVPIRYQRRPIGVLSISAREAGVFDSHTLDALEIVAAAAAKYLRRAQLYRASARRHRRPFLLKGLSSEWLYVERQIEQVAGTDIPVLIQGESGTGKELVANAIHFNSRRSTKPFVTVNCAAIPESLLESTLFGHVRGAFTGASFTKIGELEKANGGSLFLDEVGDLAGPLQAKLLRVLEQREILPLGSNAAPKPIDVRLICATHRDLAESVQRGAFRQDLFYRVGVVTLELPPLRTYKNNLDVIAEVFLRRATQDHGRTDLRLSPEALAALEAYDFPGNLRELRNCMEHAAVMAQGDQVRPEDFPRPLRALNSPKSSERAPQTLADLRETWLAPLERRFLADLLGSCHGNVRDAARRADVNVVTMYRLLRKRGLHRGRSASR